MSQSLAPSLDPLLASVTEILRVFVDALPHIPNHRRLPLFGNLLRTLGPSEYLYVGVGLLAEKCVTQTTAGKTQVLYDTTLVDTDTV